MSTLLAPLPPELTPYYWSINDANAIVITPQGGFYKPSLGIFDHEIDSYSFYFLHLKLVRWHEALNIPMYLDTDSGKVLENFAVYDRKTHTYVPRKGKPLVFLRSLLYLSQTPGAPQFIKSKSHLKEIHQEYVTDYHCQLPPDL